MAKKQKTKQTVSIIAKCIQCGKKETLTSKQILDAEQTGAAISSCCFFPMVVEKATIK
jgi:hypothetical protein